MDIRIVILPDGQIGLFTESGSYEQGKTAIARIARLLEAGGLELAEIGEVEQHRHDEEHVRQHTLGQAHSH